MTDDRPARFETGGFSDLSISIVAEPDLDLVRRLADLRAALGPRVVASDDRAAGLILEVDGGDLRLRVPGATHAIQVELGSRPRPGTDPLLWRACGLDRGRRRIVDATAGLGRDSALLLQGLDRSSDAPGIPSSLTLCERDPLLRFLLERALGRVVPKLRDRIRIELVEDARRFLEKGTDADHRQEVVYLDPMFEAHRGKSLPRQDLQALRRWCEPPSLEESRSLLDLARRSASHRVVVKRGPKDPDLGPSVLSRLRGRSLRFDIYGPLQP